MVYHDMLWYLYIWKKLNIETIISGMLQLSYINWGCEKTKSVAKNNQKIGERLNLHFNNMSST